MTLIYNNLTPGQLASRESVEVGLLWGPMSQVVTAQVILSSTTVDARSSVTTDLQAGLVLGKITSGGEYVNYSATATDGSQVAQGILAHPVQMLNASNTAVDQLATIIIAGPVKNGSCGGLNAFARAQLYGRIYFDDDFRGNSFGWRDVVAKTADYTVTGDDNGTIFTNRGASAGVNFTLPTIAKGLRYRFMAEAAQSITLTAATVDTLVVFNDAAADTVALSSSGKIIGGWLEVIANDDASKWLVFGGGMNTADDGTNVTKFTITT